MAARIGFRSFAACVLVACCAFTFGGCVTRSTVNESSPVASPAEVPVPAAADTRPKIVAFGDSLTAGYGLQLDQAYPAALQRLLDARGYQYEVVNAGVSGETTAGGLRRIDSALEGDVRVVIVALGGNDALRGLPVSELASNLDAIVAHARGKGAKVLVAGMEAPPMMGSEYTSAFRAAYAEVGRKEHVDVIPFMLEGVAGRPELNQNDGLHPNVAGAAIVAQTVFDHLAPMLSR